MEMISLKDIAFLSDIHESPSISLYLPTFRSGQEVKQNAIRFKNVLGKASGDLKSRGLKDRRVEGLLAPASRLQSDKYFWEHQMEGLAIFRTPRRFLSFGIPIDPGELVVVGNRLHLKPLFALFSGNGRFYALALGHDSARLYLGTRYSLVEQALPDVSAGPGTVPGRRQGRAPLQMHTTSGAGRGGVTQPGVFHGQGSVREQDKEEVLRAYRAVDRQVNRVLQDERAPLVLVGLEYLCPLYREASSYAGLMEHSVDVNAEELSAQELHAAAWRVVEPSFNLVEKQKTEMFQALLATGKASGKISEIVSASVFKRIDTLFLPLGRSLMGQFNRSTGMVHVSKAEGEDDEDLLDLAAVQTMKNGGTVLMVRPEMVPGGSLCAALFRY